MSAVVRRTSKRKRTPTKKYNNEAYVSTVVTRQRSKKQKFTAGKNQSTENKRTKKPTKEEEVINDLFSYSDSELSSDDEDDIVDENNKAILPHLATYLVNHPEEPPENFFYKHYYRLSEQDLLSPIELVRHITSTLTTVSPYNNHRHHRGSKFVEEGGGVVYITTNEFEALQGFSRFSSIRRSL